MFKKQKMGISLIVLIITIIVMIILATVTIVSLNSSNVIENATQAVDETNLKNVQMVASLAWGEAYVDGKRTQPELEQAVYGALEKNNIDRNKYLVEVTKNGVEVSNPHWIYKADENNRNTIVTNGKVELKIGSTIFYSPTGDAATYNGGWKVMGAEDGKLLILSTTQVGTQNLRADEDYINCETKLNVICDKFKTGASAVYARSIKIENINKITGYNPNNVGVYDPEQTGSGIKAGNGTQEQYGMEVTYSSDGTNYPQYTSGNTIKSSTVLITKFYYAVDVWKTWPMTTAGKIVTLKGTYYNYYPVTLNETNIASGNGITKKSDEYKMLFTDGAGNNINYWLPSNCICNMENGYVSYAVNRVYNGNVAASGIYTSGGNYSSISLGVRAVVALAENIKVTGDNVTGWSYSN